MFPSEGRQQRVLDIGCANGYIAAILASYGYRVTGIERPGGFDENFPREVQLICADLEQGLPDLPDRYDYVLCADILEHLRDPLTLLRQVRGVLAPGGALIASLPNSGNFWFRANILFGRFPQDDKGLFDRTHVRFLMWTGWQRLLEDAGFRLTRVELTAVPVGLVAGPGREHSLPVRVAERILYGMARFWKEMFAYQFVVRADVVDR